MSSINFPSNPTLNELFSAGDKQYKWTGAFWVGVSVPALKTVNGQSLIGSGNVQIDGSVLSFNSRTGAITLGSSDVTLALGYTPANKAGDTFTGAVLTSNAGGFTANSAAKLWTDSSRGRLDLYESASQAKSLRVMNANGYGIVGMTSAENLELWTNGVARLTLGGSGNVTASTNILVSNGADSRLILQVSGVTEGQLQSTASTIRLSSNNALPLAVATNGVDRLTFGSEGLVTFGSSTYTGFGGAPSTSARLRVLGSGLSSEVVRLEGATLSALLLINQTDDPAVNANRSGISFRKNNVEGGAITVETSTAGRGIVYYDAAGSTGAHAFYVNGVDRLRLNASGALSFSGAGYGTAGQFLKTSGTSAAPVWASLASSDVTTALGFTPYNATNPSGYITSSALSSYLPLSGGSLTGLLTGRTSGMAMSQDGGAANGSFVCRASGTGDGNLAGMTFWNDAYAIKMGIRADGYFGLGGWSRPAWSWYSAPDGSMVAAGNVTAYSDERLKKNWRNLPKNFVELLAQVKCGIYDRIDEEGLTQVGVSAQSLQGVMPDAVMKGLDDTLTVAYGNAALTAAVVLSQRVVEQEARIAKLEILVSKLIDL